MTDYTTILTLNIIFLPILMLVLYWQYKTRKKGNWADRFFYNFNIKLDNPLLTVLVPIILAIILHVAIFRNYLALEADPIIGFIGTVIVQPFPEEVIFRGILLGFFFALAKWARNKMETTFQKQFYFWCILAIGFMLQAHIFSLMHFNVYISHLIGSILFGALFLIYKRNLVPPTVAHVTSNLIVFLMTI